LQIGALVLAAGQSRRMGRLKQVLPWGDGTVIEAVMRALLASPVDEVVVVLGHEAAAVWQALAPVSADPRLRSVRNERYAEGMLTSVQAGLPLLSPDCSAFLMVLGDQPGLSPAVIARLVDAFRRGEGRILLPTHGGRRGHPVLFSLEFRDRIGRLDAGVGLRQLVWDQAADVRELPVEDASVLIDLDSPADYEKHRPGG
jgi:molybdenum cofactor cytidylyltransferase